MRWDGVGWGEEGEGGNGGLLVYSRVGWQMSYNDDWLVDGWMRRAWKWS